MQLMRSIARPPSSVAGIWDGTELAVVRWVSLSEAEEVLPGILGDRLRYLAGAMRAS